jgi:hypothetical protein
MKTCDRIVPPFLFSALVGSVQAGSGAWCKITSSAFCIGGWMGFGTGLHDVEKNKTFCPHRESKVNPSVVEPVLY